MSRRPVALAFLAMLVCATSCWPQTRVPSVSTVPRTFSLRGAVRNNVDGQAMEMIRVELKRLTGEVVSTGYTQSNGDFEFGGLSSGTYYVVIEERGYEPVRESVEIQNTSRAGVLIFLKKPLELGQVPTGPTVSARELSLPRKAREAMQKGIDRLYGKNDFKGSLPQFERAIAEVPSYYEAYYHMGIAHRQLGDVGAAEQDFRKSIEISKDQYAPADIDLAALLADGQKFADAEPVARHGIDLNASAWRSHYELARVLVGLNRLNDAEKSAQEARKRNANFASLHLLLANIHIRVKNYPALQEDLNAYLKLDPTGPSSEQARKTLDYLQQQLVKAQVAPNGERPKP